MAAVTTIARRERELLCDAALETGGSAPTLCGDWDVRHLLAHLLVRERSLVGAPGIVLPPLSGLHERETDRVAQHDLAWLVAEVRKARGFLTLPGLDPLVNTIEFFVHHEDIRRARPGWKPRELDGRTRSALWRAVSVAGRGLVRPAGIPVVIRRTDIGDSAVLRRGDDPVVVSGPVSELVLFLYGRAETTGLEFSGPTDRVERLRGASLGF